MEKAPDLKSRSMDRIESLISITVFSATFGVSFRPAKTPLGRSLTSRSLAVMSGPTARLGES